MLDGGVMDGGSTTMVFVGGQHSWQEIDRDLRMIAKRQRALDADEVALLCVAERVRIWEQLGKASFLEYLEDIFGYAPKVAYERVRVARALEEMPELYEALERGEVSYSALREVTRIATAETQREWLDSIRGKSQRQIEELARSRRKGAKPTDPADPNLKPRTRNFEVTPSTDALLRQARQTLASERGHFIDDDEFLAAMATAILEGGTGSSARTGAKFQIRVTVCGNCEQAFQEGAGRKIAISAADAARAQCDAQRIGDDHRAKQDIAPATRRFVWHRDGGKCAVPSCRSSRHIDVHHIEFRAQGGNHEAGNLTLLCDGHHRALHKGKLVITGIAPDLTCRFAHDPIPHVETPNRIAPIPHVETPNPIAPILHVETSRPAPILRMGTARPADLIPHVETPNPIAPILHVETSRPAAPILRMGTPRPADLIPHVETPNPIAPILHVETSRPAAPILQAETPRPRPANAPSLHVETASHPTAPSLHETPSCPTAPSLHVPSKFAMTAVVVQAKQALRTSGFSASEVKRFVEAALADDDKPPSLEALIVAALKHSR